MFKIGTYYNVTKKEIILVNKLVTEELYPGQVRFFQNYLIFPINYLFHSIKICHIYHHKVKYNFSNIKGKISESTLI